MQCPVCSEELKLAERQGVEIDYCPKCRGIWLDRGELDKIITRSAASESDRAHGEHERGQQHYPPPPPPRHGEHGYHKKKRKSWLGDLFDFD